MASWAARETVNMSSSASSMMVCSPFRLLVGDDDVVLDAAVFARACDNCGVQRCVRHVFSGAAVVARVCENRGVQLCVRLSPLGSSEHAGQRGYVDFMKLY